MLWNKYISELELEKSSAHIIFYCSHLHYFETEAIGEGCRVAVLIEVSNLGGASKISSTCAVIVILWRTVPAACVATKASLQ